MNVHLALPVGRAKFYFHADPLPELRPHHQLSSAHDTDTTTEPSPLQSKGSAKTTAKHPIDPFRHPNQNHPPKGKMPSKLPTTLLRRPLLPPSAHTPHHHQPPTNPLKTQVRHATFVPRPRRPYTFTQLVQLSDGSTYTVRTTMPTALLRSSKDSRNHVLWQPSDRSLRNVEADEAGKLAAFRSRFGRGWDVDAGDVEEEAAAAAAAAAEGGGEVKKADDPFDSLTDLISSQYKGGQLGGLTAKEEQQKEAHKKKK